MLNIKLVGLNRTTLEKGLKSSVKGDIIRIVYPKSRKLTGIGYKDICVNLGGNSFETKYGSRSLEDIANLVLNIKSELERVG